MGASNYDFLPTPLQAKLLTTDAHWHEANLPRTSARLPTSRDCIQTWPLHQDVAGKRRRPRALHRLACLATPDGASV